MTGPFKKFWFIKSVPVTVTKSVSGVNESRFVDPMGGFITEVIGGLTPSGIVPTIALLKSPGLATPPVVPYDSTILYWPFGTFIKT